MAFAAKAPMGPEALPRQWLYLIPLLPDAPQGWQIHVGGNLPGLIWPIPPGLDPELMLKPPRKPEPTGSREFQPMESLHEENQIQ